MCNYGSVFYGKKELFMSFLQRISMFLMVLGCLWLGTLRADMAASPAVEQLQLQIVAQMKLCDDITAQIASSNAELLRRQKSGAPADAIATVQASVKHFTDELARGQQALADLQNKMIVTQKAPQGV
jgi:hypothetical protein